MLIYIITNKITGKKYVGQTVQSLEKRIRGHCWLSSVTHKHMPIAFAIQKYGWENFEVEIACECNTQQELNEKEVYYATLLNTLVPNGYNLRIGNGPGVMAEVTKEKIRKANTGRVASAETIQKLKESHKGQKMSEKTKELYSRLYKGRKLSDEAYQNSLKSNVRTYKFLNPEGVAQTITNLKKFCRDNDLVYLSMHKVAAGARKSHKGWKKGV